MGEIGLLMSIQNDHKVLNLTKYLFGGCCCEKDDVDGTWK